MVKISVKKMDVHNFQSFVDESVDFSGTRRLVLIKGINKDTTSSNADVVKNMSNGSGKSAIAHALMFVLFGQLDGKFHNAKLKNLYSNTVRDGYKMFVTIEVDTNLNNGTDVTQWKIVRGMKKSATVELILYKFVEGEWRDVSKSSSANTQEFIEENVLLMNFDMFQRQTMLSVEDKYNFFKMNAAGKREFVELMFDTSVYSKMYKMMSDELKSGANVLQTLKANQVKLERSKEVCEDDIGKYKAELQTKIDAAVKEKDEVQIKVDETAPKFEEIEEQKKAIDRVVFELRKNKEKIETALKACNDAIYSARIEIGNNNSTISHHERELNKHKEVLSMICDDCKKVVDKFYSLDVYRKEIDELKKSIESKEGEISSYQTKIDKINEVSEKLKADESKKMLELSDVEVNKRNLQFQKNQLVASIAKLESAIAEMTDSMNDESKIPAYSIYQNILKEIADVEKELTDESTRLCLMKVGSEIVSPDAIKKNIISRMVASINSLINANLSELSVGFTCNLTQDMNDYELMSDGGELDFALLSKGEQMKLLLSTQLAFRKFLLSRFNVGMNIMIIDEVIDKALDSVSTQKLLGILLQLGQKENTNISIISHRAEVESMFDELTDTQTLVVQKENGISRIMRD